jgi:hypothetical protein
MSTTEGRLRDAAAALAATVRQQDIPPLRLPGPGPAPRPARRGPGRAGGWPPRGWRPHGWRHLLPPLAAAAAAASIIIGSTFIGGGTAGDRPSGGTGPSPLPSARPPLAGTWTDSLVQENAFAVTAVVAAGRGHAWAFSLRSTPFFSIPQAWRLDGSRWVPGRFPALRSQQVDLARASSPADIWVFTSANQVLRWNGQRWRQVTGAPDQQIGDAVVLSSTDVWAFAAFGDATWHYDGHAWTRVPSGTGLTSGSAAAGTVWAVRESGLARWTGTTWAAVSPPRPAGCGQRMLAVYAQAAASTWAAAVWSCPAAPDVTVLLHDSGRGWRVAARLGGYLPTVLLPDGHGGLWLTGIPVNAHPDASPRGILHYSGGRIGRAVLPVPAGRLTLSAAAALPGGTVLAAGVVTVSPAAAPAPAAAVAAGWASFDPPAVALVLRYGS